MKAKNARHRSLIFIAYASFITMGMVSGLLNIAWAYIQETFSITLDYLGILLITGVFGGLIAAFTSGMMIGRFNLKRVLFTGALLAAVGYGGIALAPVWLALLFFAFVASLGKGTLDAGMNNFVSANYSASEVNWLHACWGIGLTIAPTIITVTVIQYDQSWRVSYLMMVGVLLLLSLAIFLTYHHWQMGSKQVDTAFTMLEDEPTIGETLQRPIVLISIFLFFCYGGVEIGTGQLAYTLLVESRGIPQEMSSAWVSFYWGIFTIGRMLVGFLSLRMGGKILMRMSLSIAVLGAFLLMGNVHETVSFIGLLMIGFGLAPVFPLLISQTPSRVGLSYTPNVIGFQVGFAGLGAAMIPGLTGVLAESIGLEFISTMLFINAIALWLVYAFIIWQEDKAGLVIVS